MEIIRLPTDHPTYFFEEAARIHIENSDAVLTLFGQKLLTRLFIELNKAPFTGVWGAVEDNRLIGFIIGAANIQNSYNHILKKAAVPLAWDSLPALVKPRVLQYVVGILIYPFRLHNRKMRGKQPELPNPRSEFLALAVDKKYAHRFTVGRLLIKAMENGFHSWGLSGFYYGSVYSDNVNSNAFMQGCGFIPCGQITLHRSRSVQIYKKSI